jgi:hypothetical protein
MVLASRHCCVQLLVSFRIQAESWLTDLHSPRVRRVVALN